MEQAQGYRTLEMLGFNPQLSAHYHLDDFKCPDQTKVPYDLVENAWQLAQSLEALGSYLREYPVIKLAYMNMSYAYSMGAHEQIQHFRCKAVRITVLGYDPPAVVLTINKLIKQGKMAKGALVTHRDYIYYDQTGVKLRTVNHD